MLRNGQCGGSVHGSTSLRIARIVRRLCVASVTTPEVKGGGAGAGATMDTAWGYKTTSYCSGGASGADGVMSYTRDISHTTHGFTVNIDVTVTYRGTEYRTRTSFTTQ